MLLGQQGRLGGYWKSYLQTSCGGTSKDTVLRSTFWYESIQGKIKNNPGKQKQICILLNCCFKINKDNLFKNNKKYIFTYALNKQNCSSNITRNNKNFFKKNKLLLTEMLSWKWQPKMLGRMVGEAWVHTTVIWLKNLLDQ